MPGPAAYALASDPVVRWPVDPTGARSRFKLEGIEARATDPACFDVVIDADQPHEPALLGVLRVRGLG